MDGRNLWLSHFKKCDSGSLKLLGSLDKISSVCPKSRHIGSDYCGSRRTGKSCNIFSAFKIIAYIF